MVDKLSVPIRDSFFFGRTRARPATSFTRAYQSAGNPWVFLPSLLPGDRVPNDLSLRREPISQEPKGARIHGLFRTILEVS